ncbi:cytochrome-c peroxidase [Burkholderia glumae]|uniref:cytochrome-c peroxidase n=1 Tax=Burkholderia glumae TaxID=337 RepID=UPI0020B2D181|nr:cytochrome c peroxidase [Burkholderia glumae]
MRPHDVLRRARRPARAPRRLTAAAAAALACAALAASGWPGAADTAAAGTSDAPDGWRADERALLASLRLPPERPASVDPSNRVAASADAARLGKRLFADPRLSRNGAVACASCHLPGDQFQDGRPLALGIATGARRTMPVVGATDAPWLFWDGRKDSLWSQAVGPIENPSEHGATRLRAVHVLAEHYRADYARLFGALPDVSRLPRDAGPLGTGTEQAAWRALDEPTRAGVSRAFANLGKAIAAYEATLQYAPSRFDSYLDGVSSGNAAQLAALTPVEKAGLRLFIGKAQCVSCHTGPMLSDRQFHNIGVPPARRGGGRCGTRGGHRPGARRRIQLPRAVQRRAARAMRGAAVHLERRSAAARRIQDAHAAQRRGARAPTCTPASSRRSTRPCATMPTRRPPRSAAAN